MAAADSRAASGAARADSVCTEGMGTSAGRDPDAYSESVFGFGFGFGSGIETMSDSGRGMLSGPNSESESESSVRESAGKARGKSIGWGRSSIAREIDGKRTGTAMLA